MSLIRYGLVTLDDARCMLMSRSMAPSAMGPMLERAQCRYVGPEYSDTVNEVHVKAERTDAVRAQEDAENRMLRDLGPLRCLDALARVVHAHVLKDRPALARLHKHVPGRTQGELVIGCMRAYEQWALHSEERALAAVYLWASSLAPEAYPARVDADEELAQAFRERKAQRARRRASDLYGDCYLVFAAWVAAWNRKQIRLVASA